MGPNILLSLLRISIFTLVVVGHAECDKADECTSECDKADEADEADECTSAAIKRYIGKIGVKLVPPGADPQKPALILKETYAASITDCSTQCWREPLCEYETYRSNLNVCTFYTLRIIEGESFIIDKSTDVIKIEATNQLNMSAVTATESIAWFSYGKYLSAEFLFDGIVDEETCESDRLMLHTESASENWVEITLKRAACVGGVIIWNRTFNNYGARTVNLELRVAVNSTSLLNDEAICGYHGGVFPSIALLPCRPPIFGQIVKIQMKDTSNHMNLYEAHVYGF